MAEKIRYPILVFGFGFWILAKNQNPQTGLPYIPKIKNVKDPFLMIGLLGLSKKQEQKNNLANSTSLAKNQKTADGRAQSLALG